MPSWSCSRPGWPAVIPALTELHARSQASGASMSRPRFKIVRGHTVPPRDTRGRREGFTTGTAAAAAAHAACLVLLDRGWPETVVVQLPVGRVLEVRINTLEWTGAAASAGVVKDAGDDPDVT